MLPELVDLLTGSSETCEDFCIHIRPYNNQVAFTSLGMRCDISLWRTSKGVYTLVVQGTIFHNMNSLMESDPVGANLDLYFHEVDELDMCNVPQSSYVSPDLFVRLVHLLQCNPYSRFFKSLRQHSPLNKYTIVLRTTPDLDQRTFNLPSVSQVGGIWTKPDSGEVDITRDIRVYVNDDKSYPIRYYCGCYDPLQYPLLFPRGEPGWHAKIPKYVKYTHHRGLDTMQHHVHEAEALISPNTVESADTLLMNEEEVLGDDDRHGKYVSICQYYSYLFQMRPGDKSFCFTSGGCHSNIILICILS